MKPPLLALQGSWIKPVIIKGKNRLATALSASGRVVKDLRPGQFPLFPWPLLAQACGRSPLQCQHVPEFDQHFDLASRQLFTDGFNLRSPAAPAPEGCGPVAHTGSDPEPPVLAVPSSATACFLGPDQPPAVLRRRNLPRP